MTEYKLETYLAFFKFNSILNKGPFRVEWFIHSDNMDEDDARPFTPEEEREFLNFILRYPLNFPGTKECHNTTVEDAPSCCEYDMLDDAQRSLPENLILKAKPTLSKSGIAKCMEIQLVKENKSNNHQYNLPFDVVGRIL